MANKIKTIKDLKFLLTNYDGVYQIQKLYNEGVDIDNLFSTYDLKEMAQDYIDEEEYEIAMHILKALQEGTKDSVYRWDESWGTKCPIEELTSNDIDSLYDPD